MKKLLAAVIASSCAIAVPASAANVSVTLTSPGKLGEINLRAGQSAEVLMPAASGCIDFGIYERSFTNVNSTVDVVGGGFMKTNVTLRLVHLYGTMKSVLITAHQDTGPVHIVYKTMVQATCLKMSKSQPKA